MTNRTPQKIAQVAQEWPLTNSGMVSCPKNKTGLKSQKNPIKTDPSEWVPVMRVSP